MTVIARKIPALRFPEFEGEWEENVLGRIASFSKGKGILKSELNENGALECITYGELYTKYSELVDQIYSRTDLDSNKLVLSNANDVIIPASGETHIDIATASCVLREGIALGGDLNIIRSQSNSNGVFLAYYLNNRRKNHIARLAQGSSVIHLYSSQLKLLKLHLPEPVEQQKIATFLTTIDTRIQQLSRKKALLEQYKKGVMQQIFSQEIRFKDEEGKEFPAWEEKKINKLFKVTRGNVLATSSVQPAQDDIYKYPVFSSQTKNKGLLGFYKEYLYKDAITWTTDGANAGDVNFRKSKFYCTNVCGVLLSDKGYANQCIAAILNRVTRKYVSYVGNPKLMNNVMAEIKILVPNSIFEQQKIAAFLSAIDVKIDEVSQQLERMQTSKKGLLQQMFV